MSVAQKLDQYVLDNGYVGLYVDYKGVTYLVVGEKGGFIYLMQPNKGNRKLQVLKTNVKFTSLRPASIVFLNNGNHIVTGKGYIISLRTMKIMKWGETHGHRRRALELARG